MPLRLIAPVALAAVLSVATAAVAQTPMEEAQKACAADIARLCPKVSPGEGRLAECMKAQNSQVSEGCKQALFRAKEARDAQAAQGAPAAH